MGKEKIDSVRAHRKYGKFPKNTGRDNKRERIQDNLGKFFNKAKNDLKEKSNKTADIEELQQNFILFFDGVKNSIQNWNTLQKNMMRHILQKQKKP